MQFGASTRTYSVQLGQPIRQPVAAAGAAPTSTTEPAAAEAAEAGAAPPQKKKKRARVMFADDADDNSTAAAAAAEQGGQQGKRNKLEQVINDNAGLAAADACRHTKHATAVASSFHHVSVTGLTCKDGQLLTCTLVSMLVCFLTPGAAAAAAAAGGGLQ
jgi:hypothetical protein